MGRNKKEKNDCKIKFGISLDRELFEKMVKDKTTQEERNIAKRKIDLDEIH